MTQKHLEETERRKEEKNKQTYTELILHHGSIAKSRQCSHQSVCIKVFCFLAFLLHQILVFHLFFQHSCEKLWNKHSVYFCPKFLLLRQNALGQPPKEGIRWAVLEKVYGSNHFPFSSQVYVLFEQLCAPLNPLLFSLFLGLSIRT